MTERKTIKTQYSKLDECLEKLGIKETFDMVNIFLLNGMK